MYVAGFAPVLGRQADPVVVTEYQHLHPGGEVHPERDEGEPDPVGGEAVERKILSQVRAPVRQFRRKAPELA